VGSGVERAKRVAPRDAAIIHKARYKYLLIWFSSDLKNTSQTYPETASFIEASVFWRKVDVNDTDAVPSNVLDGSLYELSPHALALPGGVDNDIEQNGMSHPIAEDGAPANQAFGRVKSGYGPPIAGKGGRIIGL
jgi:hypothetical protein